MNNLAKKQRWIPQYPVYKIVTELQLNALEGHLFKVRLRVERINKQLLEDKFRSLAQSGYTSTDNPGVVKGRNRPIAVGLVLKY